MSYKLVDDERMQENVDLTKAYVSENAYLKDDTTETALADNDYIPFYDTSASSKKKSLWSNIKSVLKTYFDGIYLTSHQDISGKADKVSNATNGNFAGLDANGNLTDSGKKASDFATKATSKGSATKGVYFDANGAVREMSYIVKTSVPSNAVFTDTKNTAGSTDSSSKLFLIGATSQAANPQTYSQDTAYVDTDGNLYSGSKVVATQNMIGDAWVTSHAYAIGDYCIDGNVLYKCKTAHTSSASNRPPYASYWDAVSVADELKKSITVTVESGYTLAGNNVTQVGNLVAGCITITHGYDPVETGSWIKIGTISKVPSQSDNYQYKCPVLSGNNGQHAGMARIDSNGDILVFLTTGTYNLVLNIAYKTN